MSCRCGNNNCNCNGNCWGTSTWNNNYNHCGCSNIITTPCTASTGCLSTNYAKCITYSGTTLTGCVPLTNGENLDVSLGRIVDAICALTPDDIAWNLFDYSCLASYTTAQEFAEGISEAHCDLDARVALVEQPTFSLCSLFTSGAYTITPGTTTIETILGYYAAILCDLNTNSPSNLSLSNNCLPAITTETTLNDYLQWLIDGVCTVRGALLALITTNTNNITAIRSYIGTTSQTSTGHDNTDCLAGGSADSAYDTIELIKDKLCSVDATVSAIPNLTAISLSWAPCFYNNTPTSLSTQLGRMVSQLKLQNFQFDSNFTVTPGSCGPTIGLNTTLGFDCSLLEDCSIHSLGDVTDTLDDSGDNGGSLTYSSVDGEYRPIKHLYTVTTPTTPLPASVSHVRGAEIVTTITNPSDTADQSKNFAINFREEEWLDLTPYIYQGSDPRPHVENISYPGNVCSIMKTWDGQIKFRGGFSSAYNAIGSGGGLAADVAVGGFGQPLNMLGGTLGLGNGVVMFYGIPVKYRPSVPSMFNVLVTYHPTVLANDPEFNMTGRMYFDDSDGSLTLFTTSEPGGYLESNIQPSGTSAYSGSFSVDMPNIVINY